VYASLSIPHIRLPFLFRVYRTAIVANASAAITQQIKKNESGTKQQATKQAILGQRIAKGKKK